MIKWTTRKILSFIFMSLILVVIVISALYHSHKTQRELANNLSIPAPSFSSSKTESSSQTPEWVTVIRKGDSLAKIFKRFHIPYTELILVMKAPNAHPYLVELKPHQKMYFQLNKKHFISEMKYEIDNERTLLLSRQKNSFDSRIEKKPETSVLLYKSGIIHHSLEEAAKKSGFTTTMLAQFITIFHGSINFSRILHRGDRFSVLYREYYVNGKKDHAGEIVVAELRTGKTIHRAIRFTYPKDHVGYYTPDGHGLKPFILLPPLVYSHISSYFTLHRFDPILHRIRPHLGVDYAAPMGTPIKSVGEGKVIFAGRDDGYGNAVIIKYGPKYKALYGHMEHFIRHLHAGEYVHQGEVIGYVGNTGWSTGPHLHFALYEWGIPKNPLKLKFTSRASVPKHYALQFHLEAKTLLAQLQLYEGPDLAENQRHLKINDE